jgi:hypothetical protein
MHIARVGTWHPAESLGGLLRNAPRRVGFATNRPLVGAATTAKRLELAEVILARSLLVGVPMLLRDLFDETPPIPLPAVVAPEGAATPRRPDAIDRLLNEDLDVFTDWHRAEHLLLSAQAQLPNQLEFSVALYKLYAYSNRYLEALTLISHVLMECARQCDLPSDPAQLHAGHAAWETAEGPKRKYLYALKARGFVLLRKRDLPAAEAVLCQLALIDPLDQVGGSVVRDLAERVREHVNTPN